MREVIWWNQIKKTLEMNNIVQKHSSNKIEISYFFSIKNIVFDNISSNEIYLLGENGVGKTILLQALFIALREQQNALVQTIKEDNLKYQNRIDPNILPSVTSVAKIKNVYAYGVYRNKIASSDRYSEDEYSTLFSTNADLLDPIAWLQKLHYQELEEKQTGKKSEERIELNTAIEFLTSLFEEEVFIEVSSKQVSFTEKRTTPLEFRQLSDGYKSVLIWVCDLIQRMSEYQANVIKLQDFRGTVIIDELDLFLHPKWAYKIMEKLRGWFPNIQFIISTHSPSLILGASKDAIFYKVYKENGETKVTEPVSGISNLMANSIITSPLFDLEFAGTREMKQDDFYKKELDTSGHFNIYKIHQGVEKKIKAGRKEKNIQITESDIEKWVDEAIDEAERSLE